MQKYKLKVELGNSGDSQDIGQQDKLESLIL